MESRFASKKLSKPFQIGIWILAIIIAALLIPKGYGKLADTAASVSFFASLGYPEWVTYVVAVLEVSCPILLFLPRVTFYAALPIIVIMAFAAFHSGWNTTPIGIGLLALFITIVTRPLFLRKQAPVTKITI